MKTSPRLFALCAFVVGLFGLAPAMAQQVDRSLVGDKVCTKCHDESWAKPILSIYQTKHGVKADSRTPGCQSCHGTSVAHLESPANAPDVVFGAKSNHLSDADARSGACLSCHETNILPRTNWAGSEHATRGVTCTNCHEIHVPDQRVLTKATQAEVCFACHKTQRAQIHRISAHPLVVSGIGSPPKMVCSDCHNPHGSTGPKLLVKNSVNETCYTCHAEKRGPFLWEHAPAVDDCTNCHTPHGSVTLSLLKTRPPWLCQECHSGDHGAALRSGSNMPGGNLTTINGTVPLASQSPAIQSNARFCLNCHVLIHGSNHPAGAKFQR